MKNSMHRIGSKIFCALFYSKVENLWGEWLSVFLRNSELIRRLFDYIAEIFRMLSDTYEDKEEALKAIICNLANVSVNFWAYVFHVIHLEKLEMRLENLRGICNYVLNFIHFFFCQLRKDSMRNFDLIEDSLMLRMIINKYKRGFASQIYSLSWYVINDP